MNTLHKPLFIDRDGVINRSVVLPRYLSRVEQFDFLPETFTSLQQLRDAVYEFYIITNQAGISRGQATPEQIADIHAYMKNEFQKHGVLIRGIYVCPHQDSDNCNCRKPKPGLLLQAIAEHQLNPEEVIFIGDRETDMQAARAAGVRGLLLPSEIGLSASLEQLL